MWTKMVVRAEKGNRTQAYWDKGHVSKRDKNYLDGFPDPGYLP